MLVVIIYGGSVYGNLFLSPVSDQDIPLEPWHGLSARPMVPNRQGAYIFKKVQVHAGGSFCPVNTMGNVVKLPSHEAGYLINVAESCCH